MYFSAVIVGSATGGGCDGRDLFSRVGADSGTVSGCITGSGSFRLQCNDCVVGDHLLQYLPVCCDCGGYNNPTKATSYNVATLVGMSR
jgi:hypothetical protein